MKYIKTYENNRDKSQDSIWLLPTDERFLRYLLRIGCPYHVSLEFINNKFLKEQQFVLINKYKDYKNKWQWGWNRLQNNLYEYEKIPQFKGYMLTSEEIENLKIKIDADKYNL